MAETMGNSVLHKSYFRCCIKNCHISCDGRRESQHMKEEDHTETAVERGGQQQFLGLIAKTM
jgi:hypothetical protein